MDNSIENAYRSRRSEWVPSDAHIILEVTDFDTSITRYVVYAYDGAIHVMRFFTMNGQWYTSADYAESFEDIPELT